MKTYFPVTGQSKKIFKQLDSCHHRSSRDGLPLDNIFQQQTTTKKKKEKKKNKKKIKGSILEKNTKGK